MHKTKGHWLIFNKILYQSKSNSLYLSLYPSKNVIRPKCDKQLITCFVDQLVISRYSFHFQRIVDYWCKYMKAAKPCYFDYPVGRYRV